MIEKISSKILKYLLQSEVISNTEEDKDYYQYGIEITISSVLNIILILGIGMIFRSFIESLIFLALFIPIRQFTGGFHANSYFKCNLSFCIAFLSVLLLYHFTGEYVTTYISILITFVSVAIILFKCPIEHENKPIPKNRIKFHKIIAAILAVVYGAASTVFILYSNKYGTLILYTLSLVTVLVIVAIIKNGRCKNEKR